MFNRNKNAKISSKTNKIKQKKSSNLSSVNMVSEGTEILGTLITRSDIRIAGTVDGEAKVEGKVIVAASGHMAGNVNAVNADIAGRVEGEVHVSGKLTLRQSAVVDGDLHAQSLIVEEGATFNGECHMRDYESENDDNTAKVRENGEKPASAMHAGTGEEKLHV